MPRRRKQEVPHPPKGGDLHMSEALDLVLNLAESVQTVTTREREALKLVKALRVGSFGT